MATGSDVRDILDLEGQPTNLSRRDVLFGADKPKRKSNAKPLVKKPEGLSREVWGLLYSDSRDPPPIVPTDNAAAGYKQAKIKLGVQRVRPWRWTPFANPARKDGMVLNHWRRVADEGKEYPFAKFNKEVEVPSYSDAEYAQHLHDENWSKEETDHLFDLATQFDLRFVIMQDRYDTDKFSKRSVEDLKERYYAISGKLVQIRSPRPGGADEKAYVFDADHERKRKEQLRRLWDRTPEAIEEEQSLIAEMRKIEQRKKDREKRAGDIQKLLSKAADVSGTSGASMRGGASSVKAAGNNAHGSDCPGGPSLDARRGPDGKKLSLHKKKSHHSSPLLHHPKARASASESAGGGPVSSSSSAAAAANAAANGSTKDAADPATAATSAVTTTTTTTTAATSGIRFSEYKTSGVTLRSQRIKLPSSVGQKKTKAIESMLTELGIDVNPIPTEEIGERFNDLRSDMVLLYELKSAVSNLEFELQTLRLRHQASVGVGIGGTHDSSQSGTVVADSEEEVGGGVEDKGDENVPFEESGGGGGGGSSGGGGVVVVEKEEAKKEEGGGGGFNEEDEDEECGDSGEGANRGGGGGGASTPKQTKRLSEVIDVQTLNQKKRKAALEQKNVLSKLKNR